MQLKDRVKMEDSASPRRLSQATHVHAMKKGSLVKTVKLVSGRREREAGRVAHGRQVDKEPGDPGDCSRLLYFFH